jgi:steroid delta-isomerase-like uncharacterized protein
MALEEEKVLVGRCFGELWGEGQLDVADEIMSPDYVCHAPGARDLQGREALKELVGAYRRGFPQLQIEVRNQLAEGDRVVTEFDMHGDHTGKWMGVPATKRPMTLSCCAFSRVADGMIAEQWFEWERRKLLEQLGLVPALDVREEGAE